jgi:hypothetical protein
MPSDPARPAEVRADAILARIDAAALDALAAALARLLISAARNKGRPQRTVAALPTPIDRRTIGARPG